MPSKALRVLGVLFFAFALAVPLASFIQLSESAVAYSGITIEFDRPSFAGKSQTVECTVRLSGGPAGDEGGNYTYRADLSASNMTGATATPNTATGPSGLFKFNITMPTKAGQTLTVTINATSKSTSTRASTSTERDYKIKVVDPIMIIAEVLNMGDVDAKGVTATFMADGELLGTQVFDVSADSSVVLRYNWTFLKISGGKHVITVVIDDPNNLVEFSDGNNVLSKTIYVGERSNIAGAILTVAVVVAAFFVMLMYLQKPARRPKKT